MIVEGDFPVVLANDTGYIGFIETDRPAPEFPAMTDLSLIASLEAQIEAHFDAPIRGELAPHKSAGKAAVSSYAARMVRWNAALDVLTDALRVAKTPTVAPAREFANDIANRECAAMWKAAQQRQLDGLLSSCGRQGDA